MKQHYGTQPQTHNQKRNIVWYNPPLNAPKKTNLGKQFPNLVKKHFNKRNRLNPILNKKISKTQLQHLPQPKDNIIQNHNNRVISKDIEQQDEATCNFRLYQKENNRSQKYLVKQLHKQTKQYIYAHPQKKVPHSIIYSHNDMIVFV